jgi:nitrite reductase/ring-hydroxylating ferredoxin subunit
MQHTDIAISELPLNIPTPFEFDGMKIVVVRTTEAIHAFEDVCPHAFWPLSQGAFHEGKLECPGHAWEFSIHSGKCQDSPAYCLNPVSVTILGEFARFAWDPSTSIQPKKRVLVASIGGSPK